MGIYGVVMDKRKKLNLPKINNRQSLYNHLLAELIKSLPDGVKKICLDGEAGKKHRKNTLTFLRKHLGSSSRIESFKYVSSTTSQELQLADIVVGSINRSLSGRADKEEYIKLLKGKIVLIKEL